MGIALYIVAGLFGLMGLGTGLAWAASRGLNLGLLLGSACYWAAAIGAYELSSWWPLLAGFALAWCVRLLGGDLGAREGYPPA